MEGGDTVAGLSLAGQPVTGHRSGVSTCKYSLDVANRPRPAVVAFLFLFASVSVSRSDAVPYRVFVSGKLGISA